MSRKRTTTWASVAVLILLMVIGYYLTRYQDSTTPSQPTTTAAQPPGTPPAQDPAPLLAGLKIASEGKMAGYSRDRFPHWSGQGNSCDTREVVLQRQGADVRSDKDCKATAGTWVSAYDGVTITDAGKLDIDHTVPLAEAWRSGADKWTDEQRQKFANDLDGIQLVAVSATSNRSKGDQDPAKWKPPVETYWCTYAANWVTVKSTYGLTVDQAEHDALAAMIAVCPR
ncbi:HNH endonuclease family protein [Actinosynnema sp. NPDC023587]|uniref:HNH endonuclease family protein n=1 Tax=Actinosynnema sp. NPDC023587 TaxID=3154695 RepID=UPI0033FB75E6